jgi:hypothetical protein
MDAPPLDRIFDRSLDPALVPGIYNYCDRCCHRCAFTARCQIHRDSRGEFGGAGVEAVSAVVRRSLRRSLEVMRLIADRLDVDLGPTPADEAAAEARFDRDRADPLVRRAREYAQATYGIARALAPLLADRGDQDLVAALARIEETCGTVASKIFRAVSGANHEWSDLSDVQDDANGSAKVARLLIDEARLAWRVLMERGRAAADGVPACLVRTLDELDRDLAVRFPNAMRFVRPGFDGPGQDAMHVEPVGARRPPT